MAVPPINSPCEGPRSVLMRDLFTSGTCWTSTGPTRGSTRTRLLIGEGRILRTIPMDPSRDPRPLGKKLLNEEVVSLISTPVPTSSGLTACRITSVTVDEESLRTPRFAVDGL